MNDEAVVEQVHLPRRRKQLGIAALCAGIGLLAVFGALRTPDAGLLQLVVPLGGALFMLALAVLIAGGAALGRPRLTLTRSGVVLETLFGTRIVAWDSLSAFEPTYYGRRLVAATAAIVGQRVNRNLRRRKKLAIPNAFQTPIETLIMELNGRRAHAVGGVAVDTVAAARERETTYGLVRSRAPWLTFAICAVLAGVFAGELAYRLDPGGPRLHPSVMSLIALGAENHRVILATGEWYRLLMAPLLHVDIAHLVLNCIALLMVGYIFERLVGRAWFFAFFVVGGLGGAVLSFLVNPPALTSVGASGAIMGLFAGAFASSFRLPAGTRVRSRMQMRSFQVLIPSLLAPATSIGPQIDFSAHFGGALAGALLGFVLVKAWPEDARLPPLRAAAAALSIASVLLFAASSAATAAHYDRFKVLGGMIPDGQLPKTLPEMQARSAALSAAYPRDPRSHLFRATALAAGNDPPAAERELRLALSGAQDLRFVFDARLENITRAMLAVVLAEEGKQQDAKAVIAPVCSAPPADRPPEPLLKGVLAAKLCE